MSLPWPLDIAVFLTIWFTVLFAVLPFGVRSQHEAGVEASTMVPGTDPGAPIAPRLLVKAMWTSVVAVVVFAAFLGYLRFFV